MGLLVLWGAPGCREAGVLPDGLVEVGSVRSEEYAAQILYPEMGIPLELVSPREGDPALLGPQEDELSVIFYSHTPVSWSETVVFAKETGAADDTTDATVILPRSTHEECLGSGICGALVTIPAGSPPHGMAPGSLYSLCVDTGTERVCRPRSLYRFHETPNTLRVAHLTDTHLGGHEGDAEVKSRLNAALDAVEALDPPVDLVVVTGDIGHKGRAGQIQAFVDALDRVSCPVITLSGNHDFKEGNIDEYLLRLTPRLNHVTTVGPYAFFALDSGPGRYDEEPMTVNNQSVGLSSGQVEWLQDELQGASGTASSSAKVVLIHHPPYAFSWSVVGRRREAFLRVCRRGGVSLILAGHTHINEVYDLLGTGYELDPRAGSSPAPSRLPLTLITARSTERRPSFRLLKLSPDGRFSYRFIQVK